MSATTKIAVHSLADLKNTSDDALPNYLTSLKFKQNHTQTDIRLALGYTAVAISGALFYIDWKFGWEVTKPYTAPAVIAYFILNTAFSYWIWFVENGVIFEGEGKTGKLRIQTSTKKHMPVYNLTAIFTPTYASGSSSSSKSTTGPQQTLHLRAPFTRWFTADGYFVAKPFQQWLASEIPIIGAADPKNVVEDIGRGNQTQTEAERVLNLGGDSNVLEVLEQLKKGAAAVGGGAGTGSSAGKGGKRRK
ncbi:hypothetical protein P154DRAFT_565916 [Amniculicola lignicola CBS 123094]|uniref:Signal peptidase complex subunit 2 n=1 Tax=Amniculicola lignicola CBS 123094 TaxID=1392246 RepID=A0A6A5W799_9PLEO|nr:hypothetical protein P154DRAFT_565916 [Amniculicola lignicola CBS 123094]